MVDKEREGGRERREGEGGEEWMTEREKPINYLTSGFDDCVSCPNFSKRAMRNSFGLRSTHVG